MEFSREISLRICVPNQCTKQLDFLLIIFNFTKKIYLVCHGIEECCGHCDPVFCVALQLYINVLDPRQSTQILDDLVSNHSMS